MNTSCQGCKFLYLQDSGYSNYTVEETEVNCALDLNKDLPARDPWDRKDDPDNWPATMYGRCNRFEEGPQVHLDVDGEDSIDAQTEDEEARRAISLHTGRESQANPHAEPK
jgi:hypothetical protein